MRNGDSLTKFLIGIKKLMNNFFTCIGSGLASKLPESKTNPLSFLENSCDESFH